jgi:excisionase family DNA binding protein
MPATIFRTPPAVAEILGVNPERVREWIRVGELRAANLGDGSRPRYRISQADLDEFLASRSNIKPRGSARRPIRLSHVKEFV